jgi:hypothetical protein
MAASADRLNGDLLALLKAWTRAAQARIEQIQLIIALQTTDRVAWTTMAP